MFMHHNIKNVTLMGMLLTVTACEFSLNLYAFVLASYKTDHLRIAKMIDNNAPEIEINVATTELDNKSYEIFMQKYDKLWSIAEQYAKDNGIEVKKMPF